MIPEHRTEELAQLFKCHTIEWWRSDRAYVEAFNEYDLTREEVE